MPDEQLYDVRTELSDQAPHAEDVSQQDIKNTLDYISIW